ncbi:quinone-dependent dihydroorotate dehydrogenase [Rarobacter faecitabidus]|uniref:Dihydroorotate dehydrogenase (quinone) n=1 Tax=Rarobacter faecitabidus TaxID=13243 RepID=A0A542ZV96_RARFA|nr:quinone-dependent dihydroorotate dehydrogenase [Rarobacter faecitabidus]TQL64285.1 dihydroorotate oxidase A [Rarobacter faecitabidus]
MFYRAVFSLIFKRMDPEKAHEFAFRAIELYGHVPVIRRLGAGLIAPYRPSAGVKVFGRTVVAPFGLAAGFDKNARAAVGLAHIGFGFVEVGTVTALAQPGNEPPRLFREIPIRSLRNRMGFNNDGAQVVARRLDRLRRTKAGREVVLGVNIGKSKVTLAQDAGMDYATSASLLAPYADYLVINVSSPNTPGLRDLQAVDSLRPILEATRHAANISTARAGRPDVPILVKIAPDLSDGDVDAVADLVAELGLAGVVAVNTTINHDLGPGGLSGPPELPRGLSVVRRVRARLGEGFVIIGCGGITTAGDAQAYLDAGATLVQGYTGFIYEGPLWASRVNLPLVRGTAVATTDPRTDYGLGSFDS